MSDLDGEDAFDRVLDRAIDAERRAAVHEDRNKAGDHQMELLRRDLNNARSDLTSAKAELGRYQQADDAIVNLYTRIENACQVLGAQSGPLREALAAAKKFIDPIPF